MLPDLMELSGVELSFLINEIKAKVTRGYYVSAITPITGNSFLFKLHHTTEPDIMLMIATMSILAILRPIEVKHRTLRVGTFYKLPPGRGTDVFSLSMDEFVNSRNNSELSSLPVVKWVGRITSLPRKFVEEIMHRSSLVAENVGNLTNDEIKRIHWNTESIVKEITTGRKHNPVVILDENGHPIEALPVPIEAITAASPTRQVFEYMDGVDQVLSHKLINLGQKLKTTHIDRRVTALFHDIAEQDKAKERVISKAHTIRKIASELMSMHYEGPDLMVNSAFNKLIEEKSVNIFSAKGIKYLEVAGESLELHQNPAKVSSMLFQRAKEMERGLSSIEQSKAKLMERIDKLKKEAGSIEAKGGTIQRVRSKEWNERYRWFTTSDGILAIGGRDASSNSAIIRKHLDEKDLVFRAEIHGSPFYVLKNPNSVENIGQSLLEVGQATVSFSRAWKDTLSSGDAYWVTAEQVKKGAPTGQFIPKGSFVIEGKRNYIKGIQIQLAIGILEQKGEL